MEKSPTSLAVQCAFKYLSPDHLTEFKTKLYPNFYIVVTEGCYGTECGFGPKVFDNLDDAEKYKTEIEGSADLDVSIIVQANIKSS